MGGSLGARNFPWPTTIGSSPNVNPLVSASPSTQYQAPTPAPGSPDPANQLNPITQPNKPPLAPPNPIQNPIVNPKRPIFGAGRAFYGGM